MPGDRSADGDFVGNDEMLEVDEGRDDQERHENPVGDRHLPREKFPDAEKEQRGQKFDREIAKGDAVAAIRAAAAQEEPAHQRDVLVKRDLFLAGRTKRPARFVDRQIERQPVDADV